MSAAANPDAPIRILLVEDSETQALELRLFLEEAAGVSKYKERRRETENRIRRTQENLARLTDALAAAQKDL